MNKNNYIGDLIKIGFTESEAKVYFYLLKKKNFTATEISQLAHVSRPKVYEILAKFAGKGLCTETLGRVKKYSIVNPKISFNNLCQEFEEKKKIVSNLSKALFPLYYSEKDTTDPLDYIQVVRERNRIVEKFYTLLKNAKEEILAFTKGPYANKWENNEEILEPIKKGVSTKSIYEVDEVIKSNLLKWVEMFVDTGEEVRFVYDLPLKLLIFDKKIVMCTLQNRLVSQRSLTAMIIEHTDLAKALVETFNVYWQKGITLEEFKSKSKGSLPAGG